MRQTLIEIRAKLTQIRGISRTLAFVLSVRNTHIRVYLEAI